MSGLWCHILNVVLLTALIIEIRAAKKKKNTYKKGGRRKGEKI